MGVKGRLIDIPSESLFEYTISISCSFVANFVIWVAWSGKGTGRGCLSIEQAASKQ